MGTRFTGEPLSGTNGDNEVWNLAKDAKHYEGITKVMHLRENLRSYVTTINTEAAASGTTRPSTQLSSISTATASYPPIPPPLSTDRP